MDARTLLADILSRPLGNLCASTLLADLAGWDSILSVRLMLAIEDRKGRELSAEEMKSISSVGDVDRLLREG